MTEDVSCKSCQRSLVKPEASASKAKAPSLAELRKTAKAAVAPVEAGAEAAVKPASKAVNKPAAKPAKAAEQPARQGGFSVKSAWAARLAGQGDRCRLPRGKAKQRHV
ncbi:putative membrane protein [Pseudomonas sp. M5]|nr:putative membrane protein [Pseudomonas sp. M5]